MSTSYTLWLPRYGPDKIFNLKVTTARSKVKSRSDHDVALLHPPTPPPPPPTNVPAKYELPTTLHSYTPQPMSRPLMNLLHLTVSEIQPGQTISRRPPIRTPWVKTIYRVFHTNFQNDRKMKSRLNQEFEIYIDHDPWRMLFSICFKTMTNNNLICFQLKLIYRILGTNSYLHKLGIRNSLNCCFCQQPESLLHIFYECPNSRELWNDIEKLLKERISLEIKFSCFTIIFWIY